MTDVSDEDKSRLAKLTPWEKLDWIGDRLRDQQATVNGLRQRLENINYEIVEMRYLIGILKGVTEGKPK